MKITLNTEYGEISLDIDIIKPGYTIPGKYNGPPENCYPSEYIEPEFKIELATPIGFRNLIIKNLDQEEKECYLELLKKCNNLKKQNIAGEDYEKIIDLIERNQNG